MAGGLPALSGMPAASEAGSRAGPGISVTQIRNATVHVDYAGLRFLVDPMLAERGAFPGFPGTPNSELRNPLVHLPFPIDEVIRADAVILTHLHPDHWDDAAKAALPKTIPVFTQNEADASEVRAAGFENVSVIGPATRFGGVTLTRTDGEHGAPHILQVAGEMLGEVSGVVFSHPDERTLYLAGDTVWNDMVRDVLANHRPDVVILNAGYAQISGLGAILMGTDDVRRVSEAAPAATLIATHLEAINHCILTRAELRAFAVAEGFGGRLLIPGDGETVTV